MHNRLTVSTGRSADAPTGPHSHTLLFSLSIFFHPCRVPWLFTISAAPPSLSRLHFVGHSAAAVRGKLMKQDIPACGYSTGETKKKKNHTSFDLEWVYRSMQRVYLVYLFSGAHRCSLGPTWDPKQHRLLCTGAAGGWVIPSTSVLWILQTSVRLFRIDIMVYFVLMACLKQSRFSLNMTEGQTDASVHSWGSKGMLKSEQIRQFYGPFIIQVHQYGYLSQHSISQKKHKQVNSEIQFL